MSTQNTGGPAFPVTEQNGANSGDCGMTLRDWFAGKELSKIDQCSVCDIPAAYDRIADHCYRMADAMLRAREQS